MKIKLKQCVSGRDFKGKEFTFNCNEEVVVTKDLGTDLIQAGYADEVVKVKTGDKK